MTAQMIDDILSFGIAYVGRDGAILRINKKAREILDRRDGLYLDHENIMTDDRKNSSFFEQMIDCTGIYTDRGVQFQVVRLHRRSNPDPLFVAAFRLDDGCVLLIQEPKRSARHSERIIGAWLELSNRESQLVALLASGLSLEAASEELGITAGTGRAHIRHVFAKCGVRSQAELVAMVCRFLPPVDLECMHSS
jgi:DNA-binding CsgD family transcriptional regulator